MTDLTSHGGPGIQATFLFALLSTICYVVVGLLKNTPVK